MGHEFGERSMPRQEPAVVQNIGERTAEKGKWNLSRVDTKGTDVRKMRIITTQNTKNLASTSDVAAIFG